MQEPNIFGPYPCLSTAGTGTGSGRLVFVPLCARRPDLGGGGLHPCPSTSTMPMGPITGRYTTTSTWRPTCLPLHPGRDSSFPWEIRWSTITAIPNAGFLIPVAFYKAIDHTLNAGIENMNSQLFLSASSRNLKNFHFYGTVFIDELAIHRIFEEEEYNFVSYKAGVSSTILPNEVYGRVYLDQFPHFHALCAHHHL